MEETGRETKNEEGREDTGEVGANRLSYERINKAFHSAGSYKSSSRFGCYELEVEHSHNTEREGKETD